MQSSTVEKDGNFVTVQLKSKKPTRERKLGIKMTSSGRYRCKNCLQGMLWETNDHSCFQLPVAET